MAEEPKQQPRRRRRARRKADGEASEVTPTSEAQESKASEADMTSEPEPVADSSEEVEPTPSDVEAEEATEVVLEADDEAEEEADDSEDEEPSEEADEEAEAEAPKPSRRRRRRGAPEAQAPKPAPTRRRRSQRDPNLPPPVVRAQAKYVRSSARKARLVCDHIRGKTVEEARAILAHTPRSVARDWSKLLESAVANAEHNHELVGEDLYVKAVKADEGPTIKRFRPRAMGRATRIRKRTSHLTILLTPKE
jgi:large subunit ribosomal protein L22